MGSSSHCTGQEFPNEGGHGSAEIGHFVTTSSASRLPPHSPQLLFVNILHLCVPFFLCHFTALISTFVVCPAVICASALCCVMWEISQYVWNILCVSLLFVFLHNFCRPVRGALNASSAVPRRHWEVSSSRGVRNVRLSALPTKVVPTCALSVLFKPTSFSLDWVALPLWLRKRVCRCVKN